ncbi:MAG: lantibiotic dehydratase [Saprospiraceae bacterium]
MKEHPDYFNYDYYCLRFPAQPLEAILEFNKLIDKHDLESIESIKILLQQLFSNQFFRIAIFVSSKELFSRWVEINEKENHNKLELKMLLISLYKYYSRMSLRSTPYGLFAGLTTGKTTKSESKIEFDKEKFKPILQFNIQTITEFLRKFNAVDPSVINTLNYYINNTLYSLGEKIYFVEKIDSDGYQISNLTSITLNEYIQKVLDRAKDGATIIELTSCIDIDNVTEEQKIGFINSLIQSQVLISELWPSTSSKDFMGSFFQKIESKVIGNPQINDLKSIYDKFQQVNKIEDIELVRKHFNEQDENSISKRKDFYKTDLFYNLNSNEINEKVIKEISDISFDLKRIIPGFTSERLDSFKQAFHKKYESREVLFVQAIDPNFGVGYGLVVSGIAEYTPLVEGIPISPTPETTQPIDSILQSIQDRAKKEYFQNNAKVVHIDEDIKRWLSMVEEKQELFDGQTKTSMYIFGSLLANSLESLDNGDFKFRPVQAHSPHAGKLLSRFLHGDETLDQKVKKTIQDEQEANPDVIFAEVLYIPDGKYANINLCTPLRDYEIVYSSTSSLPLSHQINVNDLTVSIRNDRVVLRSIKLNKEIIPCVTNTYDAEFGNPIYQFLCEVGLQNINHGYGWSWGSRNYKQPYLPRIEYRKFILQRARWFINKTALNYKDDDALLEYFGKLKEEVGLDRYLIISAGDNEFLIDLDNEICRYILGKNINRDDVILFEFLKTPENCFVKENGKSFSNELIIPMGTRNPMYRTKPYFSNDVRLKDKVTRIFAPGSEWLFVKIYSGTKVLEEILTEIIGPFADDLIKKQIIDKWFFLRYDDPDYHLRVRFHRSNKSDNSDWYLILEHLQAKLNDYVKEEHTLKIMVDTYQRELERYGSETIESSESIFYADSVAIYKFAGMLHGNEGEEVRWKFGLISIDLLLNDFGFSWKEKKELLANLSADFFQEFTVHSESGGKYVSKAIRDRYRKYKLEIANLLSNDKSKIDPDLLDAYRCFEERSEIIKHHTEKINSVSKNERDSIVASYIHMTMNRLFIANQRKHELVIYHFMNKFYESIIARKKNKIHEKAI